MVSTAVVAGVVAALVVVVGVTGLVAPVGAFVVVACRVEPAVVVVVAVLVHDAATSESATSPVHSASFQFLLSGSRLFMFTPYISHEQRIRNIAQCHQVIVVVMVVGHLQDVSNDFSVRFLPPRESNH
jgi:hypothetical protein